SMAYLIIEPGMAAARVGKAEPLPRDDPAPAVAHAMAGELFGMRFIYLEAGSGASQPVPPALVAAVREAIKVMLIVGGGIRTVDAAAAAVAAGADMVVTGTLVERSSMVKEELQPIIGAVHAG
ncbi:MAG TPA: geranylgeranylglyceryl phosphate synthase family protein, partial [Candidatus Poseidoniales archaeon]|nr:geranylgeranylglyceryl phosphate synthase family protein [Candidatus Poseidoniales archaeon]